MPAKASARAIPEVDVNQFYSLHAGRGVNFLFGDGHVTFLKATMNYKTYLRPGHPRRGRGRLRPCLLTCVRAKRSNSTGVADAIQDGAWALLLSMAWGCGEEVVRIEAVPLDQLPPGSLEAAARAVPGVTFDQARRARFNGQDAFEIRGKDKRGKIREVEVSTSGQILEIE